MGFHPKRILVGVDFSECGTAALKVAKAIAQEFHATLIAVHANPAESMPSLGTLDAKKSIVQSRKVRRKLKNYLRQYFQEPFLPFLRILDVPAADAILWSSRTERCDLIVVGTRGRGGLSRLTLGSVAERVLRQAEVPVLTVRSGVEDRPIHRILCPVNYSAIAGKAFNHAVSLARVLNAELIVLYSVESEDATTNLRAEAERLRVWAGPDLGQLGRTRLTVRRGNAGENVLRYASRHDVDMIVIGAEHRRFSDVTVIGATTERVTRYGSCPVLTVIESPRKTSAEVCAEESLVPA